MTNSFVISTIYQWINKHTSYYSVMKTTRFIRVRVKKTQLSRSTVSFVLVRNKDVDKI